MNNPTLDTTIFREHQNRVLHVSYIGEQCFKVTMPGIEFKVKLHTSVLFASKVKTQKGIYSISEFGKVLDSKYLNEFELLEKKVQAVNFEYHYINCGDSYKAAKYYYEAVKQLIDQHPDQKAAQNLWKKHQK